MYFNIIYPYQQEQKFVHTLSNGLDFMVCTINLFVFALSLTHTYTQDDNYGHVYFNAVPCIFFLLFSLSFHFLCIHFSTLCTTNLNQKICMILMEPTVECVREHKCYMTFMKPDTCNSFVRAKSFEIIIYHVHWRRSNRKPNDEIKSNDHWIVKKWKRNENCILTHMKKFAHIQIEIHENEYIEYS